MFVLDMSSLRIYLLPVLLWLCAASLRAQPDSIPPEVYRWYPQYVTFLPAHRLDSVLAYAATDIVPMVYKVNKYTLYPNAQLDSIVGLINRVRHDFRVQLAYVWIGGSASPEGPVWWNKQLGDYRSKALAAYLKDKAQLPDSLLRVDTVDPSEYTAWLGESFKYNGTRLDKIMHDIANWYGVEIAVSPELRSLPYTLEIDKSTTLADVMRMMELITSRTIKQEGGTYLIY